MRAVRESRPSAWGAASVRRYQASALRGRGGGCRFHPTCSEYALEAFERRPFVVAVGMTTSRLLRCNRLVRAVTPDPVERGRRTPRPGTLRVWSLLTLTAGLMLTFVVAGTAAADPPTGGCSASANGRDAAGITRGDPLVVGKGDTVAAEGTTPEGRSGTNTTTVKVLLVDPFGGVTSDAYLGDGDSWTSSAVQVDDWLRYGVGLYKVEVTNTGPGWTCTFVGYVKLDGNPLTTPAGLAAGGMVVVGAAGGVVSGRKKPDEAALAAAREDAPYDAEELNGLQGVVRSLLGAGRNAAESTGCGRTTAMLLLMPAQVMPILGMGGGAGVGRLPRFGTPSGRVVAERRIRTRGRTVLGAISGLVFGLGFTVLLQQYGVWVLNVVTGIVVPLVFAALFGAQAFAGRVYRMVWVARDESAPPAAPAPSAD